MVKSAWYAVLMLCVAILFVNHGKMTVSVHSRGQGHWLVFVSAYHSNMVVEVSPKKHKGSLDAMNY